MTSVDNEKCIGCGACTAVCPEIFDLKDGKAFVKDGKENEDCEKAINICPVGAIL